MAKINGHLSFCSFKLGLQSENTLPWYWQVPGEKAIHHTILLFIFVYNTEKGHSRPQRRSVLFFLTKALVSIKSVGSLWLLTDRLISYAFEELAWASFFFTSSPSYPFLRKVSFSSCWPQTHYIAEDGLQLLLKSIILPICMGCVCTCIYMCDSGYTFVGDHWILEHNL